MVYGIKVRAKHYIGTWLANHAAFCINCFQVGHDGLTPYRRIRGKSFDRPICEFAECVMALKTKAGTVTHRNKFDSRWFEGIFLGFKGNTFLVGTPNGIERCRTIRRLPEQDRFQRRILDSFRGLPWKYKDVQDVDDIAHDTYGQFAEKPDGDTAAKPPDAMDSKLI